MPVTETLELGGRLHDAVGLGLDTIVVNGLYPDRFRGQGRRGAARRRRATTLPPERAGRGAGGARRARARARSQRAHLRRLRREADAPVHTLPFLFDADVGLDEYRTLAREARTGT